MHMYTAHNVYCSDSFLDLLYAKHVVIGIRWVWMRLCSRDAMHLELLHMEWKIRPRMRVCTCD